MSFDITATHRTMYRENMRLALQQKDSKLLPFVTNQAVSGNLYKIEDVVEEGDAYQKTTRNSDTVWQEEGHDARWLAPQHPIVSSPIVDMEDKFLSGIDVGGMYVESGRAKIARGTDARILQGLFGSAQTGKNGTVLTPLDSGNVVPVNEGGSTSGLNVAKLQAAQEILLSNFVDIEEQFYLAVTAKQRTNLFDEIKATSKDYGGTGVEIKEGKLTRLFGFELVHIELANPRLGAAIGLDTDALTKDGSGYRKNPFWCKSGVFVGMWESLFTSIDRLPNKHHSTGIYARRQCAATRTDEAKVGYILCQE